MDDARVGCAPLNARDDDWPKAKCSAGVPAPSCHTVLEILESAVGVAERRQRLARYTTWTAEFNAALAAQRLSPLATYRSQKRRK